MSTNADRLTRPDDHSGTPDRLVNRASEAAPPRLDLLDDEYAQEILVALCSDPRCGRELTALSSASRSTVYRRLERLEAAGFVGTETVVDPDGHHCDAYRLARDRLTVRIDADGLTVTVQTTSDKPTSD